MRNNLAMKKSREETSTTNDRDDAARTLGLGLGQHAMAKNGDEREGGKNRLEVTQVMVARHTGGRRRRGDGTAAARAAARRGAARAEQRGGARAEQRGGADQGGSPEEEGRARRWRKLQRLGGGFGEKTAARARAAVGLKTNETGTKKYMRG
jgi:hypothetical protein